MLNSNDLPAIRELRRAVGERKKPLLLWVGAGASAWLGYPLWMDCARSMRRDFRKYSEHFDDSEASRLIQERLLPQFFEVCKNADEARYYRFLSASFQPRQPTPLYEQFVGAMDQLSPLQILTTNIDESIEQRLPKLQIFQRSDFSGCLNLLPEKAPFVVKLHGSRSAIGTVIFTADDYEKLRQDAEYINILETLFNTSTVLFVGYSVRDQYLLDLLSDNARNLNLFGPGPHFVLTPELDSVYERTGLRKIGYSLKRFPDHRAALSIFEIVHQTLQLDGSEKLKAEVSALYGQDHTVPVFEVKKTAYFISEFVPAGIYTTSQIVQAQSGDTKIEVAIGLGFTKEEMPSLVTTAPHDFVVGLICFDYVYLPLDYVGALHHVVGSASFWRLMSDDIVRFVYVQHRPAYFRHPGELKGSIGFLRVESSPNPDTHVAEPESPDKLIRRQIKPAPGQEATAEIQFSQLESRVVVFDQAGNLELANFVRDSLLMPEVGRLLGLSEAILPSGIPEWLRFPCLRMAHLVHTGAICDHLGLQVAKIPFGGASLASAAFGVQVSVERADHCASYALTGRFDSDLGAILMQEPTILEKILDFRAKAEGEDFRKEIRDQLLQNEAAEFSASIDCGLKRNLPAAILDKANRTLSDLLTERIQRSPVPAVWTNSARSDGATARRVCGVQNRGGE